MSEELNAQPAVLRATIEITRAATGKVEVYEITGTTEGEPSWPSPTPPQFEIPSAT